MKDFESLHPENIRSINNGKIGKLADGRQVNVKSKSSKGIEGSAPTLEIQEIMGKKKTKIRYKETGLTYEQ